MTPARWHRDLPDNLRDEGALAFVAALLAWREGMEQPVKPEGLDLERVMAQLADPRIRRAVVTELSVLVPGPDRRLERRGKGHGKGQAAE